MGGVIMGGVWSRLDGGVVMGGVWSRLAGGGNGGIFKSRLLFFYYFTFFILY